MGKLTIDDLDLKDKKVLVRVDFNVPLDERQNITDDKRIVESLPTINKILDQGGKAILMSHLGRPKGKKVPEMSLRPAADRLGNLLGKPVKFVDDCIGDKVKKEVEALQPGGCVLLENLRYYPEEEKNDPEFARKLAGLGEVYVNDAFGTAHRAHASTVGVTRYFEKCAAGYLMQKEIKYLGDALASPSHPFVALLGGAKISGKIDVIKNLMDKVDIILIGGGMAFTFYKAMGMEIGSSLIEDDKVNLAKEILAKAKVELNLPLDLVVAKDVKEGSESKVVQKDEIPSEWKGVDIGPKTIELFSKKVTDAKTIVWNGPMGIFETDQFSRGTLELARALSLATERGATTIVGGGDTASAVLKAGVEDKISHISTGGGASLEFLEGKLLPGIKALSNK